MKLSINWLSKFLSLDGISPEEVASKLTMGAFEVEEVCNLGPKLKEPIVVGKITDIEKHPNADKLSVVKVTTDGKNQYQIVCGAKNIKVGQLVPLSLEGAVVVNRHDGSELLIKTTKIRGIESSGMLCSPGELGIKTLDMDGIFIFPESEISRLGHSVVDYLSLNNDVVLEVAARSNRGDALSVYGIGREVSSLVGTKLKKITFKTPKINKSVKVVESEIENTQDTYLFYTVAIENVKVCESPAWMTKLIESVGLKPINNVVDITNYINFTFGQPMHAYDRAKLRGLKLTARLSKKGEKITTIDGKNRDLSEGILVISDEINPVAIAGIMGGKDSEVSENTTDIVLEAAVFNPAKIRKGSRTVGLTTEASKRFERGVDSNFTYNTLLYAVELIEELASKDNKRPDIGKISQAGKPVNKETIINLDVDEVKRVLGVELSVETVIEILESLEFKTKLLIKHKTLEVQVPPHRTGDISRQIDLIEEIARLYGYDKIPVLPPSSTLAANKSIDPLEIVKKHFLSSGFSETYLSSLIGEKILINKEFQFNELRAVKMINPLSKEHAVLRQTLLPGLIESLRLNQNHQNTFVKLFEIGKIYTLNQEKRPTEKETCVTESLKLGGILSGLSENWLSKELLAGNSNEILFFKTKGIIESFFTKFKIKADFLHKNEECMHPNIALKIVLNGKEIGILGQLHPELESRFELLGPTIVFEISLEPILEEIGKPHMFEKISFQPLVIRDITIDLFKKHNAGMVLNEIIRKKSEYVLNIDLISVYELDKENISLTYRLTMQDPEQTLTNKQVEDEINRIKSHLTACLGAKFRV